MTTVRGPVSVLVGDHWSVEITHAAKFVMQVRAARARCARKMLALALAVKNRYIC